MTRTGEAPSGDALSRLEYPRLGELLGGLVTSVPGRRVLEDLRPFTDRDEAALTLVRVEALQRRHESGKGLAPFDVGDLDSPLARLRVPGSVLSAEEFLALAPLLRAVRVTRRILEGAEPELAALASPLTPTPHLERAIDETVTPEGAIRDSASPRLRSLRREREQRRDRLRDRMERLASTLTTHDAATLVTLRDGRYVLAVAQEQRGKIRGLVQDRSASGSTFFMEPLDVVEDNNALREMDVEERAEIQRVLAALTDRFRAVREELQQGYEAVGELDALRARVLLAVRWGAVRPELLTEPRIHVRGARHPLLLEARGVRGDAAGAADAVVPLDLELDRDTRLLLITGPNMGGKTVALKALGFLSALAQTGCLVPAAPGCELPWVDRWLVSLGDEQSLEHDLSTFAAHLQVWGEAVAQAGPASLVLLDELGSGTDPAEGSALARSILERLVESGTLGLVSTHLGGLKGFASATAGIRNASMAFDPATRRPTYRLAVGIPGESHAIDMARRLGFPEDRVARAEELLPVEEREVKDLLAELGEARARLAEQEQELADRVAGAERLESDRREKLERLLADRAALRTRAARQARDMVQRAEGLLRQAEKAARETRPAREATRSSLSRERAHLARLETPRRAAPAGKVPERVEVGRKYFAEALGMEVEVVRVADGAGRVQVIREGMRVNLPRSGLRELAPDAGAPVPGVAPSPEPVRARVGIPEVTEAPGEVHLRGLRVDEAMTRLERALDQALLAGLPAFRVVHGKGTGTLRRAVEEFCRNHPAVKGIRIAEQWEGGTGATVIELEG